MPLPGLDVLEVSGTAQVEDLILGDAHHPSVLGSSRHTFGTQGALAAYLRIVDTPLPGSGFHTHGQKFPMENRL